MSTSLPNSFPDLKSVSTDFNPAIRLFGKRFISEQTLIEYATEFLAIVFSEKWIDDDSSISTPLPPLEIIKNWPKNLGLAYKPPIKLNLKLFSFLSSSRVDTRHEVHKKQYENLYKKLMSQININKGDVQEAIGWIEELLRGFQGAGFNRAWCAQCFFPISKSLLTQETIWNVSVSRREQLNNWIDSISNFHKYYSVSKHRFTARGGELLYLQLCNIFTINETEIIDFANRLGFSGEESDLSKLYHSLQNTLQILEGGYTSNFDELIDYLELLDIDTHKKTNQEVERLECEWCPKDSWQEGYLFAVEIKRLLSVVLDPIERLEMFVTGCALQVLRSVCAQSVRYSKDVKYAKGSTLGYAWLFTPSDSPSQQQRMVSQRNLQANLGLIQKSLRHDELKKNAAKAAPRKSVESLYREADNKYGHKLFLSLGKKMGIIAPFRGPGARFIMTDSILQYMVLVLLRPGERCTYDDFLKRLYLHFGIAVEGEELKDAVIWSELPANRSMQPHNGSWLEEMLQAGGFLNELSDACSIVCNNFAKLNFR